MSSVVAIRHIHFEDLGTIEPLLREHGHAVRYIDAATDDLMSLDPLEPDLLVVLGGPIGAFDDELYPFVTQEASLVKRRLEAALPVLGICLGAQIMARALGARVYPMGVKEIGFSRLKLTADGVHSPLAGLGDAGVLHWHGDQFDIPVGAVRLASTDICPNQAFSVGKHALALQFHIEAVPQMIERWLVGHANELGQAGVDPRTLRHEAMREGDTLARSAREIIGAWLKGLTL